MEKAILFLLIAFSACMGPKQNTQNEEDELYTEAFCALMKTKHEFNTPNNISNDTLLIIDQYYIDTTSIYYSMFNLGFKLSFIDSVNKANNKVGEEGWNAYRNFSSLRNYKKYHKINSDCLDSMKIKLVSKNDIINTKQKYHTYLYSPLIKHSKNTYSIYEQNMLNPAGFIYSYIFKKVGNGFEFVRRTYHSDEIYTEEDYMKTIDFSQTYEEFLESRK